MSEYSDGAKYEDLSPFDRGWHDAFDWCSERKPHEPCPYAEASKEAISYAEGYDQGIAGYEAA